MKLERVLIVWLAVALFVALGFFAFSQKADCSPSCVPTFCGADADCLGACRCFKPDDVTGYCG